MQWEQKSQQIWTWIVILLVLASNVDAKAKKKPEAVSIPIRNKFLGYDGDWSVASLRVGTPPAWVDLLVSTASQETWVIGADGCDGTSTCFDERGGTFKRNASSTWKDQGKLWLGLDAQLGFGGQGNYGLDRIAIDNDTSVDDQIIASLNTTDYLLGFLGLGIQSTNLTGPDQRTFLTTMVENKSLIPSHSYGYTAGASYRLKGVPASLTLGGVDTNRYRAEHNSSFSLDPDQRPAITLNSITATANPLSISDSSIGWKDNSQTLLGSSQASLFIIDSTTPFLWFPEDVCLQFEKALNLTYDDNLQLYTFQNDTKQHEKLVRWNITFEFNLGDLPGSSNSPNSVKFTLPYSAFDLKLTYPFPKLKIKETDPGVNYFPLRKAANNTQYTIGRAFLQETYLIVDYERNNFSIYPATFAMDPLHDKKLEDITRLENSTLTGPSWDEGSSLSKGTLAGIVIACILAVAFIVGLIFLLFIIKRSRPIKSDTEEKSEIVRQPSDSKAKLVQWLFNRSPSQASSEFPLDEARVPELQAKETGSGRNGTDSELDGTTPTLRGFFERDHQEEKAPFTYVNAIGHDPSVPVELPYRSSNYRTSRKLDVVQELAPSPDSYCPELPSARPDYGSFYRTGTKKSTTVSSPSDGEHSGSGNVSDPTQIVSPISPDQPDEVSSLETIARRAAWYVSNESPSISSESRAGSPRSMMRGPMSISGRAGFPARHSRQNTVSSLDRTGTPGTPSALNFTSSRGSPSSYTKVPRNSRATNSIRRADSTTTSGEDSDTSTVSHVIRKSVQRGFSWLHPHPEEGTETRTTQPTSTMSEQSPYSPARWIEFWRTGRDPRLGPLSERRESPGG